MTKKYVLSTWKILSVYMIGFLKKPMQTLIGSKFYRNVLINVKTKNYND